MAYVRADEWSRHYGEGRGFRPLGEAEKRLLRAWPPGAGRGGRALEVCCGTGELAVFLASLGYQVDAVDFAEGALLRARTEHTGVEAVRWWCLNVEHTELTHLREDGEDGEDGAHGYGLITVRLAVAFFGDRVRVLRRLAGLLGEGGALVVITPTAARTPEALRDVALDDAELAALTVEFRDVERFEAEGLAVLVVRE
ncbi:class I SAM-dependent methyltransferase [Streptomyces sp. NPDC058045]|uniref:class I SAM-dependent methyltransferase n=1 Tax=Streptomyces sp. NPDC058045 TaxID=3346311 RepID=UPI0036E22E6E